MSEFSFENIVTIWCNNTRNKLKGQADAVGGAESVKDLSKQNKGEGTDGQGQKKDGHRG